MAQIFISHVEEDEDIATRIAQLLEEAGYTTWFYERDSIPGVSYLIHTGQAIDKCAAIILLMSASSIESHQVTREVERAYESQKRFIPILIDISHEDFITSQPIWREVIGTQTSISIPPDDIDAVIPRVIKGLEWLGIYPKAEPGSPTTDTERQKHDKAGYRYGPRSLDGRVAVSGERVFVFGYKPAAKKLYGRGATAEECTKQLVDGRAEFLCIHGPGGIGKSSLASLILSLLSEGEPVRFERFIWYDLRGGADPETVLMHLINIVAGGRAILGGSQKPDFDVMLNLLRARISSGPTLAVFDNLDSAFDALAEAGTFSDNRWPDIFRAFMGVNSAVIVTSREVPRFQELSAEFRRLDGIAREDAVNLLREHGLKDDEKVLSDAHELLQGHPMALLALAAAIMRRASYGGRLERADDIMNAVRRGPDRSRNPVALFEEVIHPNHLPAAEYKVITAMSILRRRETADAIGALRPEIDPAEVPVALDELCLRSLVQTVAEAYPPCYSLHPLVKEVAAAQVNDAKPLHERAYEYYVSLPVDLETRDAADVEHLRLAVYHALRSNGLQRAYRVLYGEFRLAELLEKWGRFDLALPLHRQELDAVQAVGTDEDRMRAARLLSTCYLNTGHYEKALVLAREALDIAVLKNSGVDEGACRFNIGLIHYRTGNFDESHKWLEDALRTALDTGDRRKEGIIRGSIGRIMSKRGKFDEALEWLADGLAVAVEIGDSTGEIEWSDTIGQIYYLRGDLDKAAAILRPALDIAIENGDKLSESRLSTSIGRISLTRGDFDEARRRFEAALRIVVEIGNRRQEGALQALIANIHSNRGEYDKALGSLENALRIAAEIGSRAAEAFRRGLIGNVYLGMGDLDTAMECFSQALDFTIQSGNRTNECAWRGKIGEVHLHRGEYENALEWLGKALDIAIEMKDKENESEWRGKIGQVYLECGKCEEASEWLEKALQLALEIGDPVNERCHRLNLGRLHMDMSTPCEAVRHFRKALEITEGLDMVSSFIEEAKSYFEKARRECGRN